MRISRQAVMLFVAAALLAVFASCVESKNPLSNEKTSKIDERLIGIWKENSNDDVWKIQKRENAKNTLDVELEKVVNFDGPAGETFHTQAFATTIKSKNYLSILDSKKGGKTAAYMIYQYTFVDNNTVQVRGMENSVLEKAIANKQIAGKIVDKYHVITDTPAAIARYIEAHANECYPEKTAISFIFIFKR
jgi:hypothetical protein